MKHYKGISELITNKDSLPSVGWLFVDRSFDTVSRSDIASKTFIVTEDDDEEIAAEKQYKTWLEVPTFLDVLETELDKDPKASESTIVDAAIYYLENDAFKP